MAQRSAPGKGTTGNLWTVFTLRGIFRTRRERQSLSRSAKKERAGRKSYLLCTSVAAPLINSKGRRVANWKLPPAVIGKQWVGFAARRSGAYICPGFSTPTKAGSIGRLRNEWSHL